jgi:hypothetical protein
MRTKLFTIAALLLAPLTALHAAEAIVFISRDRDRAPGSSTPDLHRLPPDTARQGIISPAWRHLGADN